MIVTLSNGKTVVLRKPTPAELAQALRTTRDHGQWKAYGDLLQAMTTSGLEDVAEATIAFTNAQRDLTSLAQAVAALTKEAGGEFEAALKILGDLLAARVVADPTSGRKGS